MLGVSALDTGLGFIYEQLLHFPTFTAFFFLLVQLKPVPKGNLLHMFLG